jgi:hypothetical protein
MPEPRIGTRQEWKGTEHRLRRHDEYGEATSAPPRPAPPGRLAISRRPAWSRCCSHWPHRVGADPPAHGRDGRRAGQRPWRTRLVRRHLGPEDGGDDAARSRADGGRVPWSDSRPGGHPRLRGRLSDRVARIGLAGLRARRRRPLARPRIPRLGRGGSLPGGKRDPRRRAVPADAPEGCVPASLSGRVGVPWRALAPGPRGRPAHGGSWRPSSPSGS